SPYRLQFENITKTFPGVRAVQNVSLSAYPGEILALAGENGAGKSTLMNVLNGVVAADSGQIRLDGELVDIQSPREALNLGITMIHQELALIPQLTIGQNMYLGREPRRKWRSMVDWKALYACTQADLDRLGLALPPSTPVLDLSIAQRQLIEITKALSYQARLIVLDEPTSALTEKEAHTLFNIMRSLREQGVTLIYISHRMEEIFTIADRIAVMRDGQLLGVSPAHALTPTQVVQMMVGRELDQFFPKTASKPGSVLLQARNLCCGSMVKEVNLEIRAGEVVGLAGLVGSGRTDLARVLFGADIPERGQILLDGIPVSIRSPRDAIQLGIGFIPEDRKTQGVFLGQTVRSNAGVGLIERLSRFEFIPYRRIEQRIHETIQRLNVRTPSIFQRARNLSGGNQQKIVIARWLALNPRVLILDEPTRGVDVASKSEIHALISELAAKGIAILMISSELPEILGVSDRILVMREGRLVAEFRRASATQAAIMEAATGQTQRKDAS
ncbi:MAG: sugar ABC transporter ATP-binding protein, partial [Anaerolineaceae bacterium]|nr:sugar ABC transporter ATP-binding protein [Anaerolineaceae bacterium]